MNKNSYAIIMAGGVGTRFWPLSREAHPKQFLDILGFGESLLQMTYRRFASILPEENILIVTNEAYRDLIKEQIPSITDQQILGEPTAKNTAPCIAYAMYKVQAQNPDANCVVAPSDHLILDESGFKDQISKGLDFVANSDGILTLGIKPSRPDTGYGYIRYNTEEHSDIRTVLKFTEKPDAATASEFIASGDYLWNAGIFLWNVEKIISAFESNLPEMAQLFASGKEQYNTNAEQAFIDEIYPKCENISIDYGVIEKAKSVFVLPSEFGWSDLGTWKSLFEEAEKTEHNNVVIGENITIRNAVDSLIVNNTEKLIIVEGSNNMVIVNTKDAILICSKDKEQEVKSLVSEIKKEHQGKYN
jgi:mannose-1-phosphate guanylyltransferase